MVKHTQRIRRLKSGPILESKGMGVIFSEKGQRNVKTAKYLKILAKMYKS